MKFNILGKKKFEQDYLMTKSMSKAYIDQQIAFIIQQIYDDTTS